MAARQIVIDIVGDSKGYTSAADKAIKATVALESRLDRLKRNITTGFAQGFGISATSLATRGLGMMTDAIGASIKAASDQEEALSKVNVVFGEQSREIQKWAATSVTAMGMSKTAALSAAGTLGNLFDGLGVANDAGLEMSKTITQLAADLGSFNNVAADEAMTALQAGLLGEAEPMRRFGVALSEAKVQSYGMANGLGELVQSGKSFKFVMTDAEKVTARYQLILRDTKNAQGDFARTSDGMANSSKSLDAALENLTTEAGKFLIGPAKDFINFLNDVITGGRTAGSAIQEWLAEQRRLRQEIASSKGEWASSGDVVQDYLDILTAVTMVTDPEKVMPGETIDRIRALGEASGHTERDLLDMWVMLREGGASAEEAERFIRRFLLTTDEVQEKAGAYMQAWDAAWKGIASGAEDAGGSIKHRFQMPVIEALTSTMSTLESYKEPWKAIWKQYAEYAKDPFRPAKFERFMERYSNRAARKAAEAAANNQDDVARNWSRLARAARRPVVRAMTRITGSVEEALRILALVKGVGSEVVDTIGGFFDFGGSRSGGMDAQGRPLGQNAAGTSHWRGGWTMVGEKGPELMRLPSGTGIKSTQQAAAMMGGGTTVNVSINVAPTADAASVGREVTKALHAYRNAGGSPALKAAVGF